MVLDDGTTGEKLALVSAIVAVASGFLPWAKIQTHIAVTITVTGIEGDGLLTAGAGFVVLALLLVRNWRKLEMLSAVGLGSIIFLVGYYHLTNLPTYGNEVVDSDPSAGIGLYLTVLAGVGILAGAIHTYRTRGWSPELPGSNPQPVRARQGTQQQHAPPQRSGPARTPQRHTLSRPANPSQGQSSRTRQPSGEGNRTAFE